uniref:Uncharacterized protein n=1 Tax=Amphimedon queenslandica TaxID=400682 RepID=A0A1X7U9B8_AMPQE
MIGSSLIHQTKKAETYFALASGMVGLCPSLIDLKDSGTDCEKAIGNAFSLQFHKAMHLLYVKRDIQRKLHDLGISDKFAKEFIKDIFGYLVDNHYTEGLVDSESPEEFDDNLQKCRNVWDKCEM